VPKESAKLTQEVVLDRDSKWPWKVLDRKSVTVHVQVNPMGFMAEHWKYLLATLCLPFIDWIATRVVGKKKSDRQDEEVEDEAA
jgi:hypothetical protein